LATKTRKNRLFEPFVYGSGGVWDRQEGTYDQRQ
jgi:hypothetical protein